MTRQHKQLPVSNESETNGTQKNRPPVFQKLEREKRDGALRLLKEEGLSVLQIKKRLTGINRGIVLGV